jgi:uroporphyrin-III C-methyltransferase/precorrin-2 dehydrogenase/sirohydrochlorin ferrochelatase
VSLLRHADLILYDALVPSAILKIARRARRFYVGKRAGRHSITQDAINRLMIRAARRGDRVVRLKCGDPFVFGRGGEEALALRHAGIPFEIVPGVTAAFAAPALAGIPVTHRGAATGVVVVSGHAEDAYRPLLDSLEPASATVVVLMGLATRAQLATRLIDRGWAPGTSAAIVFGAGHAEANAWLGRLDALGALPIDEGAPGTIVIGAVVGLAQIIGSAIPRFEARSAAGPNVSSAVHAEDSRSARG